VSCPECNEELKDALSPVILGYFLDEENPSGEKLSRIENLLKGTRSVPGEKSRISEYSGRTLAYV